MTELATVMAGQCGGQQSQGKERHLLTLNSPEPSFCPAPCPVHRYLAPDISAAHSLQAGDFHDSPSFQEEYRQSQKTRLTLPSSWQPFHLGAEGALLLDDYPTSPSCQCTRPNQALMFHSSTCCQLHAMALPWPPFYS